MGGLETEVLERIFKYKRNNEVIELPEVSLTMSPEEHLKFYIPQYPEFAISNVYFEEFKDGKAIYTISGDPGNRG